MIRLVVISLIVLSGCARVKDVGKPPDLTELSGSNEHFAMSSGPLVIGEDEVKADQASLWAGGRRSLLGDRRAVRRGDILTVVISIDERAEFANSSARNRSGSESANLPELFGLPQELDRVLPNGASSANAVSLDSSSGYSGDGSIRRNERLTLRVAATIVETLANGVLRIEGTQEVRLNNEVRVLLVTGFVRPEDITRKNEITYDKIASARISYGGRGQITDVQQPRYGQQIADIILPF
jgi:flagellar L-ring protein precursor FlgH